MLTITRGLPGCGKTTWARVWVAQDPGRRARVNRDDLRGMAHDSAFIAAAGDDSGTERAIVAVRDAAISTLLRKGIDVVCDDTNLPSRALRDLRRLAVVAGADFTIHDMTNVAVDECVRRDDARARTVGEQVINEMYRRYVKGRGYPLPVADEPADAAGSVDPYEPPADAPRAVLVDVDGTVALMVNRSPYDETRIAEDRPNTPVIAAVRAMHATGHEVIFCSARTESCREATEKWLTEHVGISYRALFMRALGDGRKDAVVKLEIFDREIRDRYHVVAVFDDRRQVVEMWRQLGLTVFQVAPGEF